jgi:hypothetical protein
MSTATNPNFQNLSLGQAGKGAGENNENEDTIKPHAGKVDAGLPADSLCESVRVDDIVVAHRQHLSLSLPLSLSLSLSLTLRVCVSVCLRLCV